ncbi:FAD-dependent oxidoreductase [Labrys wisconsinensis]|uniref:3-oxosteroid 1-dehydrogenase n=1 Tax=Labrys wisconsinensis TaxID=425677 RepID=A0ABU0J3N6_9HYPH|nr:FAD-dependent oxidoreductase [Labrys wisconsinensis]MDQ0467909.1 3-oxosteroid 1-dehydrogenase [Labrys wisconsinensis]
MNGNEESCDVLVIGSGSAALSAALRAAAGGLDVLVLEKTGWLGGTSAMSGAGVWLPANPIAKAAGLDDSPEEALAYLRAVSPPGWQVEEDRLWQAFAEAAPRLAAFLIERTPLRFELIDEPDPMSEQPGGKLRGRMLSPKALSRRLLGRHAGTLRRSTLPHLFTYREMVDSDPYHHPVRAALRVLPKLAWRLLTDAGGQGTALMTGLLKGCLDAGCRIELKSRAMELLRDESNAVTGAAVEQDGRRRTIRARRGVVLATGGFEWHAGLLAEHFPGPLDRRGSPRTNAGDGQIMAAAAGARLDRMDQANIYPCLPTTYEGQPHGLPFTFQAEPHSIVVDRHGRRFISESDFNIGEAMDRRDPATGEPVHLPVWLIGDRRLLRRSLPFLWYARKQPGWVIKAPSIEALAGRTGVPAGALAETIARFNRFCDQGRDEDFARGESAWESYKSHGPEGKFGRLDEAPFVAMSLNRSILGTKGGARTNERGQVLREDGSIIAGLYAAGLAMANPIGTRAVGAGTTLGPNLTWGFICAETLLRENR